MTPRLKRAALIKHGSMFGSGLLVGIDKYQEEKVGWFEHYLDQQTYKTIMSSTNWIILGKSVLPAVDDRDKSVYLRTLPLGDPQFSSQARKTKSQWRQFKVAGRITTGLDEIDDALIIIPLDKAQEILGVQEQNLVTLVGIHIDDNDGNT